MLGSWGRTLVQTCILFAFATEQSAALPLPHPSSKSLTAGVFSSRAASTPDLQFTYPTGESINAGTPLNITWQGASGPATLALINAFDYGVVDIITSGVKGSYFVWTPPSTISSSQFALELRDEISGAMIVSHVFSISRQEASDSSLTPSPQSPLHTLKARNPAPSHPDISTAAKIGVGVGSALICLTVIGGIVLYRIHCRRKQRRNHIAWAIRATSDDCFARDAVPSGNMVEVPPKTYVRR